MVHDVGRANGDQRRELVGEHVERVDLQRTTGSTGIGEIGQRAARQVVDDVDGVAFGDETIDQVRTEKPGATDDQYVHVESAGGRNSPDTCSPDSTRPCRPTTASGDIAPLPILPMTTEFVTTAPSSTTAPASSTESVMVAPGPTDDPIGNDAASHGGRRIDSCTGVHTDSAVPSSRPVEQIQVGLEVQRWVACVEPVVVGRHREQAPVGDDLGERGALDRHLLAGGDALQHRRLQHVRAAVDLIARRGARRGLLDESLDPAVAVGGDDAERRWVVDADEVDGRLRRLAADGSRRAQQCRDR